MVVMPARHVTHPRNRLAIQRHGLIPRDTNQWNWPGANTREESVYVVISPGIRSDGRRAWMLDDATVEELGEIVVWVDIAGLPIEQDRVLNGPHKRVLERITPDRIMSIQTKGLVAW